MAQDNSRLALTLVRTLFVAVGQAIETGNYSVLRDLAAPDFRRRYSQTGLETALAPLRDGAFRPQDAVLLVPAISSFRRESDDKLRIVGSLAIAPAPLRFDLLFQDVAGSWQLLGFQFSPEPAGTPDPDDGAEETARDRTNGAHPGHRSDVGEHRRRKP
ncbi:hypothetical protein [Aureimonas sp. AU4]|uniref:hypothetical protein n=1 Tax=Aureimonas sp. AU4 TaxID=1638163 RepID=UPI000780E56C|nr:hypothetical protein [Aureimonas sp. AU4]